MKIIRQLPFIIQNEAGTSIAGECGCVGVDESKVHISPSNGIYVFDSNTLQNRKEDSCQIQNVP